MELDLTIKQSELLFEATEIFQQWYINTWGDSAPSFDLLLELNHQKLMDIVSTGDLTSDQITERLHHIIKNYTDLRDNAVDIEFY